MWSSHLSQKIFLVILLICTFSRNRLISQVFIHSVPTSQPSNQPTIRPSICPTSQPSSLPSAQPTCKPSIPTSQPSLQPSGIPSSQPSLIPTITPSSQPTSFPTQQPSSVPSNQPTLQPSSLPTDQPSNQPSSQPTIQPSAEPTQQPTLQPSCYPTSQPSSEPTCQPSTQPTGEPSIQPTSFPSSQPSLQPTSEPSSQPSENPSSQPTSQPSSFPTTQPSGLPTNCPTTQPSSRPSSQPSTQPSMEPSSQPSSKPSTQPSVQPSLRPSNQPSSIPSMQPSTQPTSEPSAQPTLRPSCVPTMQPTSQPSCQPSNQPTGSPSSQPSRQPSNQPSTQPSSQPSRQPSMQPSRQPTVQPSRQPTAQPTRQPTRQPTSQPSRQPSRQPTSQPTRQPTSQPSRQPSNQPTSVPTQQPSSQPTIQPSSQPTSFPSSQPTIQPTSEPSNQPTQQPSMQPSMQPTSSPSDQPSAQPTRLPSSQPTRQPSSQPSRQPSIQPSAQPSRQPSSQPSVQPSSQPTMQPSCQPTFRPSGQPSSQPSSQPSLRPTCMPSAALQYLVRMQFKQVLVGIDKSTFENDPRSSTVFRRSVQSCVEDLPLQSIVILSITDVLLSASQLNASTQGIQLVSSFVPGIQILYNTSFQPQYATKQKLPSDAYPIVTSAIKNNIISGQFNTSIHSFARLYLTNTFVGVEPTIIDFSVEKQTVVAIVHSAKPTSTPTGQPSALPTNQPTGQPSLQPSTQPSEQPSSQPSSSPTSQPTYTVETEWLFYLPYIFQDPWKNSSVISRLESIALFQLLGSQETRSTYAELLVRDSLLYGGCRTWERFRLSQLKNSFDSNRIDSFTIVRQGPSLVDTIINITCQDPSIAKDIVHKLSQDYKSQINETWMCGSHRWTFAVCANSIDSITPTNITQTITQYSPALCVNCNNPCHNFACNAQAFSSNIFVLSPCQHTRSDSNICGYRDAALTIANIRFSDRRAAGIASISIGTTVLWVAIVLFVMLADYRYGGPGSVMMKKKVKVANLPVSAATGDMLSHPMSAPQHLGALSSSSAQAKSPASKAVVGSRLAQSYLGTSELDGHSSVLSSESLHFWGDDSSLNDVSLTVAKGVHGLIMHHITAPVSSWYKAYPFPSTESLHNMSWGRKKCWEAYRSLVFVWSKLVMAHQPWSDLWSEKVPQTYRWLTALRLFCKSSCIMLLTSLMIASQYLVDDGFCSKQLTQSTCESRSLGLQLPYGRHYCSWMPIADEDFGITNPLLQVQRHGDASVLQVGCVWSARDISAYDAVFIIALVLAGLMIQEVVVGLWIFEGLLLSSCKPLSSTYLPQQLSKQANNPLAAHKVASTADSVASTPMHGAKRVALRTPSRQSSSPTRGRVSTSHKKKKRNQVSVWDPQSQQQMTLTVGFDESSVDEMDDHDKISSPSLSVNKTRFKQEDVRSAQRTIKTPSTARGRHNRSRGRRSKSHDSESKVDEPFPPYEGSRITTAIRQGCRGGFGSTMTPYRNLFATTKQLSTMCPACDPLFLQLTQDELFSIFLTNIQKRNKMLQKTLFRSRKVNYTGIADETSDFDETSTELEALRERWLYLFQMAWQQYAPGILQYQDTKEDVLHDQDIEIVRRQTFSYCLYEAFGQHIQWMFVHPHYAPQRAMINHHQQYHPVRSTWRQFVKYELQEVLETALGVVDSIQSNIIPNDSVLDVDGYATETSLTLWHLFLVDLLGRHSPYATLLRMMSDNLLVTAKYPNHTTNHRYPWIVPVSYQWVTSELARWTISVCLFAKSIASVVVTCYLLRHHTVSRVWEWLFCCLAVFGVEGIFVFGWITFEENWLLPVLCMPVIQALHEFVAQRVFHMTKATTYVNDEEGGGAEVHLEDSLITAKLPSLTTCLPSSGGSMLLDAQGSPLDGMVAIRPSTTAVFPSRATTAIGNTNRRTPLQSPSYGFTTPHKQTRRLNVEDNVEKGSSNALLFAAYAFVSTQVAEVLDLNCRILQNAQTTRTGSAIDGNSLIDPFFGMKKVSSQSSGMTGTFDTATFPAEDTIHGLPRSTRAVIDTILEFSKSSLFPETIGSTQWPGNLPLANPINRGDGTGQPSPDITLVPPIVYVYSLERWFLFYVTSVTVTVRRCVVYAVVIGLWLMWYHICVVAPYHAEVWALFGGVFVLALVCMLLFIVYRYTDGYNNLWWGGYDSTWFQFLFMDGVEQSSKTLMFQGDGWQYIPEYFYFNQPLLHLLKQKQNGNLDVYDATQQQPPYLQRVGMHTPGQALDPSLFELSNSFEAEASGVDSPGSDTESQNNEEDERRRRRNRRKHQK